MAVASGTRVVPGGMPRPQVAGKAILSSGYVSDYITHRRKGQKRLAPGGPLRTWTRYPAAQAGPPAAGQPAAVEGTWTGQRCSTLNSMVRGAAGLPVAEEAIDQRTPLPGGGILHPTAGRPFPPAGAGRGSAGQVHL